ncbi:MAG TPA: magnesium transporter CorA family protein [Gammaproteobacteria bacterium]
MISTFEVVRGRLEPAKGGMKQLDGVVWIDLVRPTEEEERALERALGIEIPTRDEMQEIELSSRLYRADRALYMTATLPAQADSDDPELAPVTFVLARERLITVRYHDPSAFRTFAQSASKTAIAGASGEMVLVALLEVIVDRMADIVERVAGNVDSISRTIFAPPGSPTSLRGSDFQRILREIGRKGDLGAKLRDSLASLDRLGGFMTQVAASELEAEVRARLATLNRDVRSLINHSEFLSQNVAFLLNATLGMINIEQNAIIRIFSVAAVVFLPPTLIASVYGMNFEHMPELGWTGAYPLALALMAASAILPLWYFKRRGWL